MANKAELAREVRRYAGITHRAAADCVDAVINVIAEALAEGGSIELRGLGTFTVSAVAERKTSLNQNGMVPAHRRVVFRPCEKLRRAVWELPERRR